MVNVHNGIFVERVRRTQHVESFRFRFTPSLTFVPGQFAQLIFDASNPANREVNKYLSFSSSPQRDYCEVTKRLTDSAFSGRLQALKEGDTVLFKAPLGNCVLKDEYRQLCFLIGGIGITPVISMLEYIVDNDLPTDAVVLLES